MVKTGTVKCVSPFVVLFEAVLMKRSAVYFAEQDIRGPHDQRSSAPLKREAKVDPETATPDFDFDLPPRAQADRPRPLEHIRFGITLGRRLRPAEPAYRSEHLVARPAGASWDRDKMAKPPSVFDGKFDPVDRPHPVVITFKVFRERIQMS